VRDKVYVLVNITERLVANNTAKLGIDPQLPRANSVVLLSKALLLSRMSTLVGLIVCLILQHVTMVRCRPSMKPNGSG
jgi:hypothetical protein